jgi:predicted oxidoreductase
MKPRKSGAILGREASVRDFGAWQPRVAAGTFHAMQTLPLGRSELRTSRLAYGCWRIARTSDPAVDLQTGRAALEAALDSGYTLFDHADIYCDGRAEEVFGRVLSEMPGVREKIVVASKCGIRKSGDPLPDAPYRYDFSRDYIVRQCEASLRRLEVERIDVYQLHRPDWLMDAHEVADAFDRLHRAGKVRVFGVSNFLPSQLDLLQSAWAQPLVMNQIEISLCQRGAFSDGTLDQCQTKKIVPLAWSPLGGGLLADGASEILDHQRSYRVADLIATLDEIARAHGTTRDVIAIAWLLRHPSGIVPIVGSTRPERIRAATKATDIVLTREEWYRLLTAARNEPLP